MIHITDSDPSRCSMAGEFLLAGRGVTIGDYFVRMSKEKIIEVSVPTRWAAENQTKERQEEEIAAAKSFFRGTVSTLPYIGQILAGAKFSFIVIDDYRTGAVVLTPPTTPHEI
jgi:hypothetical protein